MRPSILANSRSAKSSAQRRMLNAVWLFCGGSSSVTVAMPYFTALQRPASIAAAIKGLAPDHAPRPLLSVEKCLAREICCSDSSPPQACPAASQHAHQRKEYCRCDYDGREIGWRML